MKPARILIALLVALLAAAGFARADDRLDELRNSGAIGERFDGFAVVHATGADATVKSLVDVDDAKRKQIYEAQAKKEGAPVVEVGKVYAGQIASKAPKGTWFLGEDGKWEQKK